MTAEFDAWVESLPEELREEARRSGEERVAQGLPPRLEDPVTGARLATILDTPTGERCEERAS